MPFELEAIVSSCGFELLKLSKKCGFRSSLSAGRQKGRASESRRLEVALRMSHGELRPNYVQQLLHTERFRVILNS